MADDTRSRLIDNALVLLRSEGLEAVTLRAVGDLTGVSRTAPYRHFEDKTALLAALAARVIADLTAHITRAIFMESDPRDRLRAFYAAYAGYAMAHSEEYRLVFAPEFLAGSHPELEGAVDQVIAALGMESPDGSPSAKAALLALLCTAHGLADMATAGHLAHKGVGAAMVIDVLVAGPSW
ncbi:TetR/AcrR family transcriptional regulator [Spongiactinospora sp. TRM90649]|uniref:TetR/AcrR family transcriptional regulator n=1 Tax=Spongiactinospora sp. TRM90649 TaxID=3031114 RepID=UPI0023F83D4C|nr:TetR/AcrR family transcriptional regulator [Spongiactinospora sp. TRM90649]MDF5757561.1 TetR/AcrR family transcriptional regulator [Spongiactinospora sp. TRM90649]